MVRNEILNSIDSAADIVNETQMDVANSMLDYYGKVATLLEYYDDDEIVDSMIFTEAADSTGTKEGIGTKIMNAIKTIIESMKNMFLSLIGKSTTGGTTEEAVKSQKEVKAAVKMCKEKASKKRHKSFFESVKKFHNDHPISFLIGTTVATAGAVYGGSKALDAIGKKKAMTNFSKDEQELIKKYFDPQTNSVTIPYELKDIYSVVNTGLDMYDKAYSKFTSDLGMSDNDNEPAPENCSKYFEASDKFDRLRSYLTDIDTHLSQRNFLSGFDGSTTIKGGIKGWNETMKKYKSASADADQCAARIIALGDVMFSAILNIPDKTKQDKHYQEYATLMKHMERHQKAMYDIINMEQNLNSISALLDRFLPRYYAVEEKIDAIKAEIVDALKTAAKLVAIANSNPTDIEREELARLTSRHIEIQNDCNKLESEINSLKFQKNFLDSRVSALRKERDKLKTEMDKLKGSNSGIKNDEKQD